MAKDNKTPAEHLKGISQPKPPEYSEEERCYINTWVQRLRDAKIQRNQSWDEFNGMNFIQNYESNRRAAMSYAPPRVNEGDDRVVTGITEEKGETILAAALNYNFEPTITAYDDADSMIQEAGDALEVLVKKAKCTADVKYEEQQRQIYKEFFDQGVSYVEVVSKQKYFVEKIPTAANLNFEGDDPMFDEFAEEDDLALDPDADLDVISLEEETVDPWEEAVRQNKKTWETKLTKGDTVIEANIIPGNAVYLGNMRQRFLEHQPYIAIRYETSYEQAYLFFKDWKRWENVPKVLKTLDGLKEDSDAYQLNAWCLESLKTNQVEIIKCQDKWNNDLAIFCNGVLMTPPGYPLSSIDGTIDYSLACGHCYPGPANFAVSKGVPSKIKVDQALVDELYRALAMKSRQSYKPPLANNTGRQISKKIFLPSQITDDIDPDLIKPILPNVNGITGPDVEAISIVKSIIDGKTISPLFQGQQSNGLAATEVIENKNQNLMRIGLPLYGIMQLEKKICQKFINHIVVNWTQKQDSKVDPYTKQLEPVYKSVEMEGSLPDGTPGVNAIEFTEEQYTPEQILAEEELLSAFKMQPVRKLYINPKLLKNMQIQWNIDVEAVEKHTDELKRQQFSAMVQEGYVLFGKERFNQSFLEGRYAQVNKLPSDKLFLSEDQSQAKIMEAMQSQMGGMMPPEMGGMMGMGGEEMMMPEGLQGPPGQTGINNAIAGMVPQEGAVAPPTVSELAQLTQ